VALVALVPHLLRLPTLAAVAATAKPGQLLAAPVLVELVATTLLLELMEQQTEAAAAAAVLTLAAVSVTAAPAL
jgi:hypothetical protein